MRDAGARGLVLHLLQVGRLEALVIVQAGDLNGVQLQRRGIVDQLVRFPLEGAERIGVEAELDGRLRAETAAAAAAAGTVCRNVRRSMLLLYRYFETASLSATIARLPLATRAARKSAHGAAVPTRTHSLTDPRPAITDPLPFTYRAAPVRKRPSEAR